MKDRKDALVALLIALIDLLICLLSLLAKEKNRVQPVELK